MVKRETVVTYKCVGTESSKSSTFDLEQAKILESSSFSNRQHPCSTLPCENMGNWGTNTADKVEQRNFAVPPKASDGSYCRIPSKFFECGGRLTV